MKILIDINHPAHVHYFRNFIKIMETKGHTFIVTNRDSRIINQLLDYYEIEHSIRNARPDKNNLLLSLLYLLRIISKIIKETFVNKPDLYIGFGSLPCTIVGHLFRKPVVLIDDTEHNSLNHLLLKPFNPIILTPFYFWKKLGNNQLFFQAYVEQFYLHSSMYSKNKDIFNEPDMNDKFVLVRYISYDARHDRKVNPLPEDFKKKNLIELSKHIKVYLTHESDKTDDFYTPYLIKIAPEKMHDVIASANLFITEGATMAAEAGILGTPYIYINPLQDIGYIDEQIKTFPQIASKSINTDEIELLIDKKLNSKYTKYDIEKETINPTYFFVWFVENYPKSVKIMKENPDYQDRFK
jgi:hypothetical protein